MTQTFCEIHSITEGPALHNNATMTRWSSCFCSVMYSNKLLSVLRLSGVQSCWVRRAQHLDWTPAGPSGPSTILRLQCHRLTASHHAHIKYNNHKYIYDASPESDESMDSHISSKNLNSIIILHQKWKTRCFWICNIIICMTG